MSYLPPLEIAQDIDWDDNRKRCLILSDGFENRTLTWIRKQDRSKKLFSKILICKYTPSEKSCYESLHIEASKRTEYIETINFNRYYPTTFEQEFMSIVHEIITCDEIVIDISVMSKILIMSILYSLKKYPNKLRIIYTEPLTWSPSSEVYSKEVKQRRENTAVGRLSPYIALSSLGFYRIVKTPGLSSIVMQNSPIHLVAFLSFNEQVMDGLLRDVSPETITLINTTHHRSSEKWRGDATLEIHKNILQSKDRKHKVVSYELTDYIGVFEELVSIYHDTYYVRRFVLSPTGCKLHAVSSALIKTCCPDIHVEYPIPTSYIFEKYSSPEMYKTYQICFNSYSSIISNVIIDYHLNE